MTIIISAVTPDEVWFLADRRLSRANNTYRDDATKIFELTATDGWMLVGYAGLGLTIHGTEPSAWLASSLRCMKLTIERALHYIADAMKIHFAPHLQSIAWCSPVHVFHMVAVTGTGPKTYEFVLERDPASGQVSFHGRVGNIERLRLRKAHVSVFGTRMTKWEFRDLRRALNARARGRISPATMARAMAVANQQVSQRVSSVGPRSIVVQKMKPNGGQHWLFSGVQAERHVTALPVVAGGVDLQAMLADTNEQLNERASELEAEFKAANAAKDPVQVKKLLQQLTDASFETLKANLRSMPSKPDPTLK
jgi:hypothetical protein